ncbi:Uncharacterised protein [Moraxella lacunata]|uniref:Uncharacterized protein n=2 Tax=Moraxella lacunata TaxID=477 RepID=A0A1V4H0A8_MORLA|nr:hypothetical protein B5J94_04375 [Moraxella lacunata]STY99709.1 Uncharacterised protein [Moraxella lacunata]
MQKHYFISKIKGSTRPTLLYQKINKRYALIFTNLSFKIPKSFIYKINHKLLSATHKCALTFLSVCGIVSDGKFWLVF